MREIAEGVRWACLPLPFHLDHVNLYLIEDFGGWALLDTGARHPVCLDGWDALFRGDLAGIRLSRVIVSHFHPDHVGLAGWLCEAHGVPLVTTATCLRTTQAMLAAGDGEEPERPGFYRNAGLAPERASRLRSETAGYCDYVAPLPAAVETVSDGDILSIGGRDFHTLFGNGHATDQLMLHGPQAGLFLSVDQVIARITPYVGVEPGNAGEDTLGPFLATARMLAATLPEDVLVAPGHELPFHGLQRRCGELIRHHAERCRSILDACRSSALSLTELTPVLFSRTLDDLTMPFALGEARAHVNFLAKRGLVALVEDSGVMRCRSAGGSIELSDFMPAAL